MSRLLRKVAPTGDPSAEQSVLLARAVEIEARLIQRARVTVAQRAEMHETRRRFSLAPVRS